MLRTGRGQVHLRNRVVRAGQHRARGRAVEAGCCRRSPGWTPSGALTYALEGAVFVTGAAIQWLRDGLGLIDSAGQSEALARSVPDSGGVVFVPALTGLGAPDWDPSAQGAIFGLTRGTTSAHLIRAALEAIAFEVRDVVEVMTAEACGTRDRGGTGCGLQRTLGLRTVRADGGAAPMTC